MLNWIIDFSLRHRLLVILVVAGSGGGRRAVAALSGHRRLPRHDAGAGADQHGRAVARARRRSSSGSRFRSSRRSAACPAWRACGRVSKFGFSQVVVTFEDGTDIYFARQLVNERLATVELAEGIGRPKMGPVATGLGEVFHYVVTGARQRRHRAAHDSRLGHQAQDADRARARPKSTVGAATRSSTRCGSTPTC